MILNEIGDVMDNTSNSDQSTAVLSLGLIVVPVDDGELFERDAPVKRSPLLIELLLELLKTALLNLVRLELLQVISEAQLLPGPDGPFSGIILMPLDCISVI